MLTNLCQYLRNWFDRDMVKVYGEFRVEDGAIEKVGGTLRLSDVLHEGQYFRIVNSPLNSGVHQWPTTDLEAEEFEGAVWAMAIPKAVIALAQEIEAWQTKYGGIDSPAMSPYQSESFGGYSYSKGASATGGAGITWVDVFGGKLSQWRKI